jgi:hypothetical protein
MFRRRRRVREIPFSFDSFLDIVANVVGIIIRLILVVWVGARSYSSVQNVTATDTAASASAANVEISDPLQAEIARHRQELAAAQERLLAQLRQLDASEKQRLEAQGALTALTSRLRALEQDEKQLVQDAAEQQKTGQVVALTSAELRARSQKLAEAIHDLEKNPVPTKKLHYRTPVSRPVQSDELFFECRQGRVAFIDIAALLQDVRQHMEEKGKLLRDQWAVSDTTTIVGAFRLQYTIERERGLLDGTSDRVAPSAQAGFRYGVSEWRVEPMAAARGETADAALAVGSEFRQIVDPLDPQLTTVTFWVYPDSFDLYRRLQDYLYDRDIVVAGRPLPDGIPISSSRHGSVSRGQ